MKVHLLGTGSADGWPNPFCACASCATERAAGRSRACTAALIDQAILVDCGPTVPYAASRAGIDLRSVAHVLLTHGHPDHLAPAFLLWRQWIHGLPPLHVWGPAHAIDTCRPWIAPDAPVVVHVVAPGDELLLDGPGDRQDRYRVRVCPAAHGHGNGDELADEAVLYDISCPDQRSLLYATDTGRLPTHALAMLRDRAFDVVLVDATFGETSDHGTGHLDFTTMPGFLADLRAVRAITDASDLVAVHLSHHNPPLPRLVDVMAGFGLRVAADLDLIDTTARRRRLVLGGARSGKSTYAEFLASGSAAVTYLATGLDRPDDAEWIERIRLHQQRRPAHWHTLVTIDLPGALAAIAPGEVALVDCLGMWLTGQLDRADAWSDETTPERASARALVLEHLDALERAVRECPGDVILVSNEVGMGVVPATSSGRLFRDLLGIVNARLAAACDEVTMMIAGRPLPLPPRTTDRGITDRGITDRGITANE